MAQDRTDGQKPAPTPKFKRVPEGERVLVELAMGIKRDNTDAPVFSRIKEGTVNALGLTPAATLPKGKGKTYLQGVKGTKSYMITFGKVQTIGGASVRRVAIPVPGFVKVIDFYKWAKALSASKPDINGIISPSGKKYGFKVDLSDDK